jgi:DNA-directed RNA polymerase subunit RPC12/RpoP
MHDTIETTALTGSTGAVPSSSQTGAGAAVEKICCSCGKNVVGQKRFKDADGRYWCYDCGVEDHIAKHPEDGIACAECGGKFAPSKLISFDDDVYCDSCHTKVKQRKVREEHRKAAVEQEARDQEKKRKMMLIGAALVAVVGIGIAIWVTAF